MPSILFPDMVSQQIDYLAAALVAEGEADVWVGNRLPSPIPEKAVLVRDDGGPALRDVRGLARLGYRVWSGYKIENPGDSYDLAALCSALVAGCADGSPVVLASATRPSSVEDDSDRPVHYFTSELTIRGTSL